MALVRGAHVILYSTDADADRAFLRGVLSCEDPAAVALVRRS